MSLAAGPIVGSSLDSIAYLPVGSSLGSTVGLAVDSTVGSAVDSTVDFFADPPVDPDAFYWAVVYIEVRHTVFQPALHPLGI